MNASMAHHNLPVLVDSKGQVDKVRDESRKQLNTITKYLLAF